MIASEQLILKNIEDPVFAMPQSIPQLEDAVYKMRLEKVLKGMNTRKYDYLVLYADREHFSNFEYLTGFEPRFEEGILVLSKEGDAAIFLGNECFNMYKHSRIKAKGILYQVLSLPSQPVDHLKELSELFKAEGIEEGKRIGLVGWKLMYPRYGTEKTFDVPNYIVEALKQAAGEENLTNATDLFIHPEYGVRIISTAAEIAYLEFGAAYASDGVRRMLAQMETGKTELEIAMAMCSEGICQSCFPMMSSGERTGMGLISPSDKIVELGDPISCSQGLRGGLTCRAGYAAYTREDLPENQKDYVEKLAAPYFATVVNWFEMMKIGVCAGDIFNMVQSTFPKERYGWVLNPGHYISTEEWTSSPFYAGSDIKIKSGMCIQMDIIPSIPGYAGANCEDGFAVADEVLREEIRRTYPEIYERMMQRRTLAKEAVGINLAEEILPLSNLLGLYRPYLLNRNLAFAVKA